MATSMVLWTHPLCGDVSEGVTATSVLLLSCPVGEKKPDRDPGLVLEAVLQSSGLQPTSVSLPAARDVPSGISHDQSTSKSCTAHDFVPQAPPFLSQASQSPP